VRAASRVHSTPHGASYINTYERCREPSDGGGPERVLDDFVRRSAETGGPRAEVFGAVARAVEPAGTSLGPGARRKALESVDRFLEAERGLDRIRGRVEPTLEAVAVPPGRRQRGRRRRRQRGRRRHGDAVGGGVERR